MDKASAPQNVPNKPQSFRIPIPMMDAKTMSFDNASGSPPYQEFRSSPPLSSYFTGRGTFEVEGTNDPLTQMAAATRRDSLKGMHNLQDFSTE